MTENKIFRPDDAASYIGVSVSTLYRLVKQGKLEKPIKISERATGFRQSTLEKFLNTQASISSAQAS